MPWRVYIDDSGNREYDEAKNYVNSGRTQHFVYGAVMGSDRETSLLASKWRDVKQQVFGDPNVEIKANWLRIQHEREARYLAPYGISEADLARFVDGAYALIASSTGVNLLASVVDKLDMQTKYTNPWYAPTVAYEVLMQRVVQSAPPGETVFVTVDDIGGRTPKKNDYKVLLANHHRQLKRDGSKLLKGVPLTAPMSFAALDESVKFKNSAHSELIQVADLVSYCVLRQFRDHGADWEKLTDGPASLPMYSYFKRLSGRFLCDPTGRVQGFGIVKMPLIARVRWTVVKTPRKDDAAP